MRVPTKLIPSAENSQPEESLESLEERPLAAVLNQPEINESEQQMEHSSPDEYLSASEDSPPSATLELFTVPVSPPPQPQRSRSASRRPARLQPTVIPPRNATQPVLVTGKPRDTSAENTENSQMETDSAKATKRKSPEKPRTNKHKKR